MSRSNTRSRRSQWKTTVPQLMTCPQCRDPKLPHTACPTCGTYNRRQVITPSCPATSPDARRSNSRAVGKEGSVIGTSGDGSAAVRGAARPETAELLDALGVPLGPELLERALTHRSFAYENGGGPTHERLEVLRGPGLRPIVTDTPLHAQPHLPPA